ncbi:DUF1735 and LamG domain-containing protein [Sphingobacterium bovistauri]|uniref:DUF1735 domain-containing protein n=1 Tax=Sphingobacterium bovistauri TaxID=2781959 RepID=A0ABS7Z571_9SPHI|nr:DUF1735 and LamG domain-containing protein [Sphingobacterium bovistauri]MCA5005323.1 DUF1735 domain-containing protein [Sphingobacterium bovistauri]
MKIKGLIVCFLSLSILSCKQENEIDGGEKFDQQAILYSIKDNNRAIAAYSKLEDLTGTKADLNSFKEMEYSVGLAKPNPNDEINLTFKASPEDVANYNKLYGTTYEVFPDSLFSFTSSLKIDTGSTSSSRGKLRVKIVDKLENNKPYLLAIKLTSASNYSILSGANTIFYKIEKSVPVVNTSLALTRDVYMKIDKNLSKVNDIGSTFTIESLFYTEKFRNATDVGDVQISSLMGTEGATLLRFGDAGVDGNILNGYGSRVTTPFAERKWYHLALVVTPTSRKVYINGVLNSTSNGGGALNEFFIGRSYNDNRGFWGRVAEVRLWSVERSAKDISDGMMGVGGGSSGLYAYWKMNEVNGMTIPDASSNGRVLTMFGQGADKSQKSIKLYKEASEITIQ